MAKIFVALNNMCRLPDDFCAMPPFYESFVNGLKDAGNEVLCFQTKIVIQRTVGNAGAQKGLTQNSALPRAVA